MPRPCLDCEGFLSELRLAALRIETAVEDARESLYTGDFTLMELHASKVKLARECLAGIEDSFERHKEQHTERVQRNEE